VTKPEALPEALGDAGLASAPAPASIDHPVATSETASSPDALAAREASSGGSLVDEWRRRRVDELFRSHESFLRRLAARLCRSTFDPDDLVQDMLERTVLHAHALSPEVDHRAWMARVMRNLFIDRLRRRATAPDQAPLEPELPAPTAEAHSWWERLDTEDIRARLGELPDELRAAFELYAFHGCSYEQIARRLGIPRMTVGTRILRARRRLREIFAKSHDREGGRA
jgi:RNA polymerase sigma-70 factor, ECF subfamily